MVLSITYPAILAREDRTELVSDGVWMPWFGDKSIKPSCLTYGKLGIISGRCNHSRLPHMRMRSNLLKDVIAIIKDKIGLWYRRLVLDPLKERCSRRKGGEHHSQHFAMQAQDGAVVVVVIDVIHGWDGLTHSTSLRVGLGYPIHFWIPLVGVVMRVGPWNGHRKRRSDTRRALEGYCAPMLMDNLSANS